MSQALIPAKSSSFSTTFCSSLGVGGFLSVSPSLTLYQTLPPPPSRALSLSPFLSLSLSRVRGFRKIEVKEEQLLLHDLRFVDHL